jgi:type IV pilus biogenesis protein CpaD/CtpE
MTAIRALLCATCASLLLAGCFPAKDYTSVPDVNSITVRRDAYGNYVAIPPDCEKLLQPDLFNATHNLRPDIAFGCATYTNMAAQIANPKDLVAPKRYEGQHADTASTAVTRYREGKIIDIHRSDSTSKTGGQ